MRSAPLNQFPPGTEEPSTAHVGEGSPEYPDWVTYLEDEEAGSLTPPPHEDALSGTATSSAWQPREANSGLGSLALRPRHHVGEALQHDVGSEKTFYFCRLPTEVQDIILGYFTAADLARLLQVSKEYAMNLASDEQAWRERFKNTTPRWMAYHARSISVATESDVVRALLHYGTTAPALDLTEPSMSSEYHINDVDRRSFFDGLIESGQLDRNQITEIIDATPCFLHDDMKADHLHRMLRHANQQQVGRIIDQAENISDTRGQRFHILDIIVKRPPRPLSEQHLDKIMEIAPHIKNYRHSGGNEVNSNPGPLPPGYVALPEPASRTWDLYREMEETGEQKDAVKLLKAVYQHGSRTQEILQTTIREASTLVDEQAESDFLLWSLSNGSIGTKQGAIRVMGRIEDGQIKSKVLCEAVPRVLKEPNNMHEVVRASRSISSDDLRGNVLLQVVNNCNQANLRQVRNNELQRFTDMRWVAALRSVISQRLR